MGKKKKPAAAQVNPNDPDALKVTTAQLRLS